MKKIVVGVDGSANSVAAAAWALREAELREAELVVVVGWEIPPSTEYYVPDAVELEEAAKADLDQVLAALGTSSVVVTGTTAPGSPAQVLLDAAADAELLVVGSRGHGAFVGLVLGSVSLRVVTHARVPVVVVPLER
jgi:nucleotide-binding universal stress UspA family protein